MPNNGLQWQPEESSVGIVNGNQLKNSTALLRQRLRTLRWLLPLVMAFFVMMYELGPGHWLMDRFGPDAHTLGEVIVFGTAGPLLTFIVLEFLARWLDERETSDLQAQLMAEARADVSRSRALVDDAVQAIFSASALMTALQVEAEQQGVDTGAIPVAETQSALDDIVDDLRAHLTDAPAWARERTEVRGLKVEV